MDLSERSKDHSARHPWEIARLDFFNRLLRQCGAESTRRWLDVGSGDAWFAKSLRETLDPSSEITCWDIYYSEEDLIGAESVPGIRLTNLRPTDKFDGILMMDVVEHVEDDLGFISDIVNNCLSDSGWILVSVPAYQNLFTNHDRTLRHFRRYSPGQCRQVLTATGMMIVAEGGVFHSLLVPRYLQSLLEKVSSSNQDTSGVGSWRHGPVVTSLVTALLRAECRLSLLFGRQKRFVVPGLSYWAFCRRSEHIEHST